jgi:hypothetical protein
LEKSAGTNNLDEDPEIFVEDAHGARAKVG